MLRIINLSGIILLLFWISLIPQPVQNNYHICVSIFLIGILAISIIRKKSTIRSLFSKEDIGLWIFLIGITGGVFFADNFKIAVRQYLYLFIPLILLYYLLKLEFIQENWLPIMRTICLFSALVALFGILECLFHKNPIYEYFIYNKYYEREGHITYYPRAMSTQLYPAALGSYLLACFPFSFLLIKKKNLFDQTLGISCAILNTICIIWTFSRGTFLGLGAMFLFYFWKEKKYLFLKSYIVIVVFIILIFSFSGNILFARFGVDSLTSGKKYTSIFSDYRIKRLIVSFKMLKDHPLVGIGLNNYRINFDRYYSPQEYDTEVRSILNPADASRALDEWKIADNMYLTILAETGIIGFLSFFAFIGFIFRKGFRYLYMIEQNENKEVLIVVQAGLIGLLVNMCGYDLFYWSVPFFIFCILIGMISALSDN